MTAGEVKRKEAKPSAARTDILPSAYIDSHGTGPALVHPTRDLDNCWLELDEVQDSSSAY